MPLCRSLALLLGAVASLAACSGGPSTEARTPVVVVVLDALHGFHVTHLGYPRLTTPNLDALAADGVSFTRAFSPAPFTLASIPSLMTGRLPDSHGVTGNTRKLAGYEVTLAEHLGEAGYRTFGAVANLNGSSVYGNEQGFDEFVELFRSGEGRSAESVWQGEGIHVPRADEFVPIVRRWCAEVEGTEGGAPFFYLHLLEPHEPYVPPNEHRDRFLDPDYDGPFLEGLTTEITLEHLEKYGALMVPGKEEKDAVVALYDANVAWVDEVLGRVLDELRAAGLYDDALIVVTSDHGEAFWQHGRRGHGGYLYDEELRIPLVVKLPADAGGERGRKVERLASLTDVYPSLCQWLDLALPQAPLDGISLEELLRADPSEPDDRELILRSYRPKFLAATRSATAKTIVDYDKETGRVKSAEHFRLDEDWRELNNIYPQVSRDLHATIERLQGWVQSSRKRSAGEANELSGEERAMMEALGYVY
ncbi:MAG: sulfatase [Planctomycetota bacterium]